MLNSLTDPVPFDEAFAWARDRIDLPTNLGHTELKGLRRDIGRRGLVLARVSDARIISAVHERVNALARGMQDRPGDYIDPATFRLQMQGILDWTDYKPQPGREGTVSDLRTKARLDLIVSTETELASGRAQQAADFDPVIADAFPAWELYRARKPSGVARDWAQRWRIAGAAAGDDSALSALSDSGRMIARKDSGIWAQLGSTDNFDDALDTDHPPFAFNSGMAVKNINRATAINVGVIQRGERIIATPQTPAPMRASLGDIAPAIRSALLSSTPGSSISDTGDLTAEFDGEGL